MAKPTTSTQLLLALTLSIYICGPQAAADNSYSPPRTEYGQPDLQGIWYFGSTTPFTRPTDLAEKATYSEEEIATIEEEAYQTNLAGDAPLEPNRPPPEAGVYIGFEADFNFAAKRHKRDKVLGEYRTSLVIEPADGQLPVKEGFEDFAAKRRTSGIETYSSAQASDTGERCLIGGLPIPSLFPAPWNANMQIVQTKDYVMLMTEMVHDARIVKLSGKHQNDEMNYWNGDSIGYWENNTLVIHTKNFRPEHSGFLMRMSEDLETTERLTPVSEDKILYRVELSDPQAYTQPFVVERTISRRPDNEPIYEFACHEGNYSMQYMLMGARRAEVDAEFAIDTDKDKDS